MASPPVDTYGWNTAFALKVCDVNRLLARADASPRSFAATLGPLTGRWSFAPWVVTDASGSQITLALRFTDGALERRTGTLALAGLTCEVTCELALQPLERQADGDKTVGTPAPGRSGGATWAAVEIVDAEDALSPSERGDLVKLLEAWFKTPEAIAEFGRQFSRLQISTFAASEGLKPRVIRFAGATSPDGEPMLGILSKTLDDDITGCPLQLSPHAIAQDAQAGFVISAPTFLATLLLPALAHAFDPGGKDPSKAFVVRGGNRVINIAELQLPLRTGDGRDFVGSIAAGRLDATLSGAELTLRIRDMAVPVTVVVRGAATIHVHVEYRLGLRLLSPDQAPDHKVFSLVELAKPAVTTSTEESTALVVARLGVEVVAVVIAAIVAYFVGRGGRAQRGVASLTARVAAAVSFLLLGAAGEAVAKIPEWIEHFESDSLHRLPDFSGFVDRVLREAISWSGDVRYRAASAEFCDSVRVGVVLEEG